MSRNRMLLVWSVVVLTLVGVVTWASTEASHITGITAFARDDQGHVTIGTGNEIISLDRTGEIIDRHRFELEAGDTAAVIVSDISFDPSGDYVIADHGNVKIKKYSSTHKLVWQMGERGDTKGQFAGTMKVAVHPQTGEVFVVDGGGHRIQIINHAGIYDSMIGNRGSDEGNLLFPNGLFFDAGGDLVVVNTNNLRIDTLDVKGSFESSIDLKGKLHEEYPYPVFMAADDDQNLYVLAGTWDLEQKRAYKIDRDGDVLFEFGQELFPRFLGKIVVARDNVLVIDQDNLQILAFGLDGDALGTFGAQGITSELNMRQTMKSRYETIVTMSLVVLGVMIFWLWFRLFGGAGRGKAL